MLVIEPSYLWMTDINGVAILKHIEACGRVCYKSEGRTTDDSYLAFCKNILKRGHEAVLEHDAFTIKFIVDRAIANEIVRHRLASYCQESTRYCAYNKDAFGKQITIIRPESLEVGSEAYKLWEETCQVAEKNYFAMLDLGINQQIARDILPLSLKTEIIMTANIREWRHFFRLRTSPFAHPQMRQITIPLLNDLKTRIPVLFDDIEISD